MQSPKGYNDVARRVLPVAQRHGVSHVSLVVPPEGGFLDQDGRMHLLLNLDGVDSGVPDFNRLANDLERACGCPVELYTLESIRHSPYGKDVIRHSVMLMQNE